MAFKLNVFSGITFCLLIMLPGIRSLASDYEVSAGLTVGFGMDSNPELALYDMSYDESTLFRMHPFLSVKTETDRNRFEIALDYDRNQFLSVPDIRAMNAFSVDGKWVYSYTHNLSLVASSGWKNTSFSSQIEDVQEFRGKTSGNLFRSGIRYVQNDWYEFDVFGIWGFKRFQKDDDTSIFDLIHGNNWHDIGIGISGKYYLIPEMNFLADMEYLNRQYSDNEISPGHQRILVTLGFRSVLASGATVSVMAHMFRYEFDGDVPRRMKPDYTHYGVSIESDIPLDNEWVIRISAGSRYDITERGVRKYFYNEYISAGIKYESRLVFDAGITHSKRDYHAQEPLFKTHTTYSDIRLEYPVFSWIDLHCQYRYFHRTGDEKENRIDQQGIGLGITVFVQNLFT